MGSETDEEGKNILFDFDKLQTLNPGTSKTVYLYSFMTVKNYFHFFRFYVNTALKPGF